jgi:hypothetical protein
MGFIWGSIPLNNAFAASFQMATDPGAMWRTYPMLPEGTENWNPSFVDDNNPSHHYAGLFYMGYFFGEDIGKFTNWLRDGPLSSTNREDLNLGYLAARHGDLLSQGVITMHEVGQALRFSVDARPGIWPANTPWR